MLADELDYVIGVDTHRDQHVLAVVEASSGGVVAQRSVSIERSRLRRSDALRSRSCAGATNCGTCHWESCFGAAIASAAQAHGRRRVAIILVLRSLARRIHAATGEARELEREILDHVRALVPELLNEAGVGPIVRHEAVVLRAA